MRRVISLTILVLVAGIFAPSSAQSERRPVSAKFDEYGAINSEDLSARLDNFATQLQNQPGSTAYIFAYAPEESAKGILGIAKDYLVNTRGLVADRIKTVYGGRNDVLSEPRVQLFITPPGAARPKPQKFTPNLETFRGLFSEKEAYDVDRRESLTEEESKKLKFPVLQDEMSGPSVPYVTHESLAEVLKQQKTAVAYIVAYNAQESPPGAWQRIAQREVRYLKDRGVEASRLKIIYGGNKKEQTVQLWVSPADAAPPVSDAGPEQLPAKAVSLDEYSDSDLGYSGVERQAFKRLAEVLRQFPTARACVVVTFGTYEETSEAAEPPIVDEEPAEPDQSTEPEAEPEPEPADVAKLVENWKDELAAKYKIGADRFVVLFTRNDGFVNNMMEMWVVPPGAALPIPEGEPAPAETPTTVPTPAVAVNAPLVKRDPEMGGVLGLSQAREIGSQRLLNVIKN